MPNGEPEIRQELKGKSRILGALWRAADLGYYLGLVGFGLTWTLLPGLWLSLWLRGQLEFRWGHVLALGILTLFWVGLFLLSIITARWLLRRLEKTDLP